MAFLGIGWHNSYFHSTLTYNYVSSQWYDDENTISIDSYNTIDLQLSKEFVKKINISLIIQNILDSEFIDRKGYLSPGRFITAEIKYKF